MRRPFALNLGLDSRDKTPVCIPSCESLLGLDVLERIAKQTAQFRDIAETY